VTFVLEPSILKEVSLGYEDLLSPELLQPHMGIDESGKGDFFGPLVIAAAYVDPPAVEALRDINVRDSKNIRSDRSISTMARDIRRILSGRYTLVPIGPAAYNRLHQQMGTVNKILAWGHARAIENLLEKVPDCPRAVADQFGPRHQIERALLKKGRAIKLEQRHKAESDPAVAAASILAREGFIQGLRKMQDRYKTEIPRGASARVKSIAGELARAHGASVLNRTAKCHFKTTDEVLHAIGSDRSALAQETPQGSAA
jgi:ribonuclease HIII